MKLTVEESFPGELAGLSDVQKALKLEDAKAKAAEAMGLPRGGEVQLIADLAAEMGEDYEARRQAFLLDYSGILLQEEEARVRKALGEEPEDGDDLFSGDDIQ